MSESNQLMDFTNMFRKNEENNENMRTNLHEASFTSSLSKGSMEEPTSLELYYPEIPEEDFRNLPSSVHTLLTNLVSQKLSSSKMEQNNRTTTFALESQVERMQNEIELLRNQVLVERQDKKAASELSDSLKEEMRRKDQLWSGERKNLEGRLHKLSTLSTQFQATITQKEKEMNKLKDHLERANNRISRRSRETAQEEGSEGIQTIEMNQTLAQARGRTIATSSSMSEREELEQRLRTEVRHLREMFAALQKEHNLLISTFNALLNDYERLRRGEEPEVEKEIKDEEGDEVEVMISEYKGRGTQWNRDNSDLVLGVRRDELVERWTAFEEKRVQEAEENDHHDQEETSFLEQSMVEEESIWKARFEDAMKLLKEQDDIIKHHLRAPPSLSLKQEQEEEEEENNSPLSEEAVQAMQLELECLQDERVVLEKVLHDTLQEKQKLAESFVAMSSMIVPLVEDEDENEVSLSMEDDNELNEEDSFYRTNKEVASEDRQVFESPLSVTSRSSIHSSQSTPQMVHDQSFSLPSPSQQTTALLRNLVSPLRRSAALQTHKQEGKQNMSELSIEEDDIEDDFSSFHQDASLDMAKEGEEAWEDDLEEEEDMV